MEWIDVHEVVSKGDWVLVLYYSSCDSCRNAIPKFVVKGVEHRKASIQLAFVQVPPIDGTWIERSNAYTLGQLDDSKQWFCTSPVELLLRNGVVVSARERAEEPSNDVILRFRRL